MENCLQELVIPIFPMDRLEEEGLKPSKNIDHPCHYILGAFQFRKVHNQNL